MIEVWKDDVGWHWSFICQLGRVLVKNRLVHATEDEAVTAAKHYRAVFHTNALRIDGEQTRER